MRELDMQLEGISQTDLERIFADAKLSPDAYEITTPNRTSGDTLVDLVVELSHIDLNALSLVIGYLMGTGVALFYMEGVRKRISSVSEAMKFLHQSEKQNSTGSE